MTISVPPDLTVPSPFYRVTAKALIFDDDKKLLAVRNKNGNWELPGGGWEHDEDFETALMREIQEEIGVDAATIGNISFVYRAVNLKRGFMTLRLAVPVTLKTDTFVIGHDILEARYVARDEFLAMDFAANEGDVREHTDKIWLQA